MGLFKFLSVILVVFIFLILSLPSLLLLKVNPKRAQRWISKTVSFFSTTLLFIMRIKVKSIGEFDTNKSYFIVSNHLSYIDILIISKFMPCLFVTSVEMKRTPVLGQIVTLAGCLFVERRSKANIKNEIKDIQEAMVQGISIAVFPEATSSNADGVLPLKRSLFEAAKLADVAVKPVVINYTHVSGTNLNKINRDSICWYGDMKFVPHLLTLCFEKNINATVTFGDPILATDSIDLRDQSFNFISEHFNGLEK